MIMDLNSEDKNKDLVTIFNDHVPKNLSKEEFLETIDYIRHFLELDDIFFERRQK